MDYTKGNKKAWESAFDHRSGEYAKDLLERLNANDNPFLHQDFLSVIKAYDLKNQTIVQFCTNNGRELMQLSMMGVHKAVGFDIAENMVDYANDAAKKLNLPTTFIQADILQLDSLYDTMFDYGFITVGALCWFEDLNHFFRKVVKTLKPNATLFIHEAHPFELMFATKGEEQYVQSDPKRIVYDYFGKTIWKESGMGYMSDTLKKDTVFTSFSHTLSDVFSAMIANGLSITQYQEFDYCVGNLFDHIDHQGLPLSMIIVAKKQT